MSYPRISCDLGYLSSLTESGWHKTLILLLPPSDMYYCGRYVLRFINGHRIATGVVVFKEIALKLMLRNSFTCWCI